MVKLKSLLFETYGQIKDLFDFLSFNQQAVPISLPIIQKLVGNVKTVRAAHFTDLEFISKVLSLQGKKKGISTLTALNNTSHLLIGGGVATAGGIIVILKGDVLLQSDFDLIAKADKTGRRWAMNKDIFGKPIFNVWDNLPPKAKQIAQNHTIHNQASNEDKRYFIQTYIDTATELLLKHKSEFQKKYIGVVGLSTTPSGRLEDWNEVILTKIEIEAIAIVKDSLDLQSLNDIEINYLQKKYKKSEVITVKEIPNFLKKHGIKIK